MGKRLVYIDAAKGICMLLVMMIHIGIPEPLHNIYNVKVPLFFVLSGFFMKEALTIGQSVQKGVKRLLVPFVFFYLISYVLFYLCIAFYPAIKNMTEANGIMDCFTQKQFFNGPLWFLPCLFFVQIMLCGVFNFVPDNWAKAIVIMAMGGGGYILSVYNINLPLAFDTALVAAPMYSIGYLVKKNELFERYSIFLFILGIAVYSAAIITPPLHIDMSINRYGINIAYLYIFSISISLLIVVLCKWLLRNDIVFSYIGKNTLLLLCTHHMIYRPVKLVISHYLYSGIEPYITMTITLGICFALIPFFNKFMPWAIGKKR